MVSRGFGFVACMMFDARVVCIELTFDPFLATWSSASDCWHIESPERWVYEGIWDWLGHDEEVYTLGTADLF